MSTGTSAAAIDDQRPAHQNQIRNIIDLFTELQLWSLRDENTSAWALDSLTQERKWQINHAGKNCGVWDGFYVALAAPFFLMVVRGVLHPFYMPVNILSWAILAFVLLAYPMTNLVYSIRGLKRVKGPLTYKILSTFMTARAISLIIISFALAFVYGWGVYRINLNNMFNGISPAMATNLRMVVKYIFDTLALSVDVLIPAALVLALLPTILLRTQKLRSIRSEQIIDDLRIKS